MTIDDKRRWDERYLARDRAAAVPGLPATFAAYEERMRTVGSVLEIACGDGRASVWFALQGADVTSYDVSSVAIEHAQELARQHAVGHLCRFEVADLDDGIAAGPLVDLVFCNMFRDAALDDLLLDRLRPGGLLGIAALSEVGASAGPFRTTPGELTTAFRSLTAIVHGEGDGVAWLLAQKPSSDT